MTSTCAVDGCDSPVRTKGWCGKHYARWWKHGDVHYTEKRRTPDGLCTIEGCNKPHDSRGWCKMHLNRWVRHGDPLHLSRARRDEDRLEVFWKYVVKDGDDGCWVRLKPSTGEPIPYGAVSVPGGNKRILAHRFTYELLVGPIPDGMVIDHLCRNTACVNPKHLRPIPQSMNARRSRWTAEEHALLLEGKMRCVYCERVVKARGDVGCRSCCRAIADAKALLDAAGVQYQFLPPPGRRKKPRRMT